LLEPFARSYNDGDIGSFNIKEVGGHSACILW
jgi:hypothetical protein